MEIIKETNLIEFKITDYEDNQITINDKKFTSSFIVSNTIAPKNWGIKNINDLTSQSLLELANDASDLIIIGTGDKWQIPPLKIIAPILSRNIGIEFMDNKKACQSYNLVAGDGRKVVLGVIF